MTFNQNIDLNLIKLFASLYETSSVKATAESLNISQSACSHALQRLRERLGDELFVRVGNRMLPTQYSDQIANDLIAGLELIGNGLASSQVFDPNDSHTFRIATTDYTGWCMRPLVVSLANKYPNINIEFVRWDERSPEEMLSRNKLDLVCGFVHQKETSESLDHHVWFKDTYVSVRCKTHPLKGTLDLAHFLQYKHVLINPWGETRGIIDLALSRLRKKRQVAVKTASVITAPSFVQGTPYLLTLPRKYALEVKKQIPLIISPLPLEVPDYCVQFYWHKTRGNDPKIKWIRQQLNELNEDTSIEVSNSALED